MKRILLASALIAASSTFAQTAPATAFYLGIDGNYLDLKIPRDSPPGGFNGRYESKDKTSAVRVFGGYQFSPNWAVELGYLSSGKFTMRETDAFGTIDADLKISGVELSGVYKFTEGVPGLFLKAGVTQLKAKGTVRDTAAGTGVVTTDNGSASGSGALFGIGYETRLTGNLDGRIGFSRYQRVAGESDANINSFYLGLKYNF
ncbi:MAG: porin family protein [Polaromonas sp.]|nr:porin family protein [Polaromonas sp.]